MATFFPFVDVKVYWPLLLGYFMLLVAVNMRARLADMMAHSYVPWDMGKLRAGAEAGGVATAFKKGVERLVGVGRRS